jgi:hypothetical protein
VDSIQCIEGMRISPKDASRFDIPLCRMVYMPLIQRLRMTSRGWRQGSPMDTGLVHKDEDTSHWGPHWTTINEEFEAKLASNPHLKFLFGRMFFVCDGNHKLKAWT